MSKETKNNQIEATKKKKAKSISRAQREWETTRRKIREVR